jgi:hypothetical protein
MDKISATIMDIGFSHHTRNGLACKDKWGFITGYCKKIF